MGVEFSPASRPTDRYTLLCAFDRNEYSLAGPLHTHPELGGCQAAIDFAALALAQGFDAAFDTLLPSDFEFVLYPDSCLRWHVGQDNTSPVYEDDPVLGVSNANAAELLPLLGLRNNEWYGRLPADDFLGRVLLAQALVAPDAPRATKTHATPGHATVIDPGRSNDYTKRKLEALERIARVAKSNNIDVIWG